MTPSVHYVILSLSKDGADTFPWEGKKYASLGLSRFQSGEAPPPRMVGVKGCVAIPTDAQALVYFHYLGVVSCPRYD